MVDIHTSRARAAAFTDLYDEHARARNVAVSLRLEAEATEYRATGEGAGSVHLTECAWMLREQARGIEGQLTEEARMTLYANQPNADFVRILAPAGLKPAICVDVVDRGMRDKTWDGITTQVPKVSVHFLLADIIPDQWKHPHTNDVVEVHADLRGLPFGINRWMTNSMHENAALRQFISQWRGRGLTDLEAGKFDLDRLIGVSAGLMIVHNQAANGNWYANIDGVTTLPDGFEAPTMPSDYVRIKDRPPREGTPIEVPQNTTESGYGPSHDFSGEPIPDHPPLDEPDDSLPF